MTFVVIYDANVLYPSTLRDVLIRFAQTGLLQAKWSETNLDETFPGWIGILETAASTGFLAATRTGQFRAAHPGTSRP